MNCRMPSLTSDLINNADPFSVKSGDDVMIEWRYGTSLSSPVIEEHHIGPCLFYMASVPKGNATPQWFKIAQDGYSNDQWCVSKLIANNGIQNVTIPENLKAGNYLLRAEVIGLQLAGELYGTSTTAGAQFYMNCVHLTVTGNGKVVPSGEGLFSFPSDTYLATSPGIYYKETDPTKYQFPGPAVYEF
ncbi:hypothetical protein LPJ53_005623 [Coemansia erecta]|uniref:lytic cellulose monooxygenase (C4-dehydrogenating) n=1 Tax=Coemansia erecta TaxID=147472 RepID=A0A9W7XX56_9FUNG|nr:hypothetical protein LPJ53_005623 [Coemansia erecta]